MNRNWIFATMAVSLWVSAEASAQMKPGALPQPVITERPDMALVFVFNSSELDQAAKEQLDRVADWAKVDPARRIVLDTSQQGTADADEYFDVDDRRAMAARKHLVERGVPKSRIFIVSEATAVTTLPRDNPNLVFVTTTARPPDDFASRYTTPGETFLEEERGKRPRYTRSGLAIAIGGGVMDFLDNDTRGFTSPGGTWEARMIYGTRSPIAIEAAYVGSLQSVDSLGLDDNAGLLASAAEADIRVNAPLLGDLVQPYVFAGGGITRYQLVREKVNQSNLNGKESAFHFPAGLGLGFHWDQFMLDVRGTVRPTIEDQLARVETSGAESRLHSWSATAMLGAEF